MVAPAGTLSRASAGVSVKVAVWPLISVTLGAMLLVIDMSPPEITVNESEAELAGGPALLATTLPPPSDSPRTLNKKLPLAPTPPGSMPVQVNFCGVPGVPGVPQSEQPASSAGTTSSTAGTSTVMVSALLPETRV